MFKVYIKFLGLVSLVPIIITTLSGFGVTRDNTPSNHTVSTSNNHHSKMRFSYYTNSLSHFKIEYPSSWSEGPRAGDGSGRVFYTSSGVSNYDNGSNSFPHDVVLFAGVFGNATMGIGQGMSFNEMVSVFKKTLHPDAYILKQNYIVIPNKYIIENQEEKVGHNALQLRQTYISLNTINDIYLTFPLKQEQKYLALWKSITHTFNFGSISYSGEPKKSGTR